MLLKIQHSKQSQRLSLAGRPLETRAASQRCARVTTRQTKAKLRPFRLRQRPGGLDVLLQNPRGSNGVAALVKTITKTDRRPLEWPPTSGLGVQTAATRARNRSPN